MEKHILSTIAYYGCLTKNSVVDMEIRAKYWEDDDRTIRQVFDMLDGLVDDGFINALFVNGKRRRGECLGLTAKGLERLYELEHPILSWTRKQWFPLAVAVWSSLIGIVSIIISIIFRS